MIRALRAAAAAIFCLIACTAWAATEEERALEQRVKAAFIYRFIEFVIFPEPMVAGPLVIAVAGSDAMAEELRRIASSRPAGSRPIEIRRVGAELPIQPVHVLFVADRERPRMAQLMRAVPRAVVVTESDGALSAGSIINFVIVDGRVRFEISPDGAEKRGLRLSSRLLALAQNVRAGGQ